MIEFNCNTDFCKQCGLEEEFCKGCVKKKCYEQGIDDFANEMSKLMRLDGVIYEKEIDRIAYRLKSTK